MKFRVNLVVAFILGCSLFPSVVSAATPPTIEQQREKRDQQRINQLGKLVKAINATYNNASSSAVLCNGMAFPCYGNSTLDSRASDGTGWVKVNLSAYGSLLPIDPINSFGASGYHYVYCADKPVGRLAGYEIDAKLESAKYSSKMATDGGDDVNLYEVGSNLTLVGVTPGCTY